MQRADRKSPSSVGLRFAAAMVAGAMLAMSARSQPAGLPGSWATKAPLRLARNEVAAVALNEKIYVLGGSYPRQKYDVADNSEYDPGRPLACTRSDAARAQPCRRRRPQRQNLRHRWLRGSNHKGVNDSVFEYDPASDTWRALPPLSSPRGSVAVTAVAGKLHALGGRKNENDVVTAHEVYDPATGKWSEVAPLPRGRDHMAAVTVDGKIRSRRRALWRQRAT